MALTNAQKRNAEKNRRYWAEREAEQLKHNITEEAEYDKEIKRIYQNMLDACQKEIESFYAKYASSEGITIAEAKKRVSKLDIAAYERKAAKYVKEKNFSKKANEEMRLYNATMKINRLEMLKANIGLETIAGHDELEKFMGGILKGRTEDELKRQAGILGKTITNNAAKADAIVNGSFHSGTFSDRIWQYQDLMRQDLGKLLQQGLIQGKGARAITKDLRKYLIGEKQGKGATYNVERLMRTELARVQTEAQKQSFIRNGFTMYEFICNHHASKHGTCDICQGLNGKHFKVDKMMPGENAPPMHPHCRCSTAAWEDDAEYEAWLDFLEKGGTTAEWNKLKDSEKADYMALSQAQRITEKPGDVLPTSVNAALVNTKEYHDKFEGLTSHKAVNEALYQEAMKMLEHRDRTEGEDMILLDSRTGKIITGNTQSTKPGRVGLTDEQFKAVQAHKGDVIIIHNHPNSSRISYKDILTMYQHENVSAVVAVGHDGSVQIVSNLNRKFEIDKYWEEVYNNAVEIYQDTKLATHKATTALYELGIFDTESR